MLRQEKQTFLTKKVQKLRNDIKHGHQTAHEYIERNQRHKPLAAKIEKLKAQQKLGPPPDADEALLDRLRKEQVMQKEAKLVNDLMPNPNVQFPI